MAADADVQYLAKSNETVGETEKRYPDGGTWDLISVCVIKRMALRSG